MIAACSRFSCSACVPFALRDRFFSSSSTACVSSASDATKAAALAFATSSRSIELMVLWSASGSGAFHCKLACSWPTVSGPVASSFLKRMSFCRPRFRYSASLRSKWMMSIPPRNCKSSGAFAKKEPMLCLSSARTTGLIGTGGVAWVAQRSSFRQYSRSKYCSVSTHITTRERTTPSCIAFSLLSAITTSSQQVCPSDCRPVYNSKARSFAFSSRWVWLMKYSQWPGGFAIANAASIASAGAGAVRYSSRASVCTSSRTTRCDHVPPSFRLRSASESSKGPLCSGRCGDTGHS